MKLSMLPPFRTDLVRVSAMLNAAGVEYVQKRREVTVFRTHACTGGGSRVHDLVTFRFGADGRLVEATEPTGPQEWW